MGALLQCLDQPFAGHAKVVNEDSWLLSAAKFINKF